MPGPNSKQPKKYRPGMAYGPERYDPRSDFRPISNKAEKLSKAMLDNPTSENIQRCIPYVMAARVTDSEIAFRTDAFINTQSVKERFPQLQQAFQRMTTPYVIEQFKAHLAKTRAKGLFTDSYIKEDYCKSLLGSEESAGREFIAPEENPTARQQIGALQKRLKMGQLPDKEQKVKALSQILAAREVLEVRPGVKGGDKRLDSRLTPDVFLTAIEKYETPLRSLSEQQIEELSKQAQIDYGGALTEAYGKLQLKQAGPRKAAPAKDPEPAAKERLTAKAYIESMQLQLKKAETLPERLQCVAGIIAARELVDAKRGSIFGGDKALNKPVSPEKLAARTRLVSEYVRLLNYETKKTLISQAKSGHGGEMLETYRKENLYTKYCANLRIDFKSDEPGADMAQALAVSQLNAMQPHQTVDEAFVEKLAAQIRREPGYEAFSGNPHMQDLLHNGNFEDVGYYFTRRVLEPNRAARQAQSKLPEAQPEAPKKPNEKQEGPVRSIGQP